MHTVLSIAGSDSGGGAGIQADLKTITCLGAYGMTVITAITAQNTTGVSGMEAVSQKLVAAQMDAVFTDIPPEAVKLGMIPTPELMEVICRKLTVHKAKNIVVDPVMASTSGSPLMEERTVQTLKEQLLPVADIVTPNIREAEILSGVSIEGTKDMEEAAERIAAYASGAVLVKGGHLSGRADDLLYHEGKRIWISGERIASDNTHGTGCTLSSAIATFLAMGYSMEESVRRAKAYVAKAIGAGLNLGRGSAVRCGIIMPFFTTLTAP